MMLSTFVLVFAVAGFSLVSGTSQISRWILHPNTVIPGGTRMTAKNLTQCLTNCLSSNYKQIVYTKNCQCLCITTGERQSDDIADSYEYTTTDYCNPSPCFNEGSCSQPPYETYRCSCPSGVTGVNCETRVDPCQSSPCNNGGACSSFGPESFACTCPTGYTGERCDTKADPCASSPCVNGGECNSAFPSYSCSCPAGYTGTKCETEVDPCDSSPCVNGGECISAFPSYSCSCPTGYTGTKCETEAIRDVVPIAGKSNCIRTNYPGQVTDLYNAPNGVTWPYQIANFGFNFPPCSVLGIPLNRIVSIVALTFSSCDNMEYFRIVFEKQDGQILTTDPIGPNDKKVALTGVNNVKRVTFYLASVDFGRNVTLKDVSLKCCYKGLLGVINCFLFDVVKLVASLVPFGIIRPGGTTGSFSVSIAQDYPYIDLDLVCAGIGIVSFHDLSFGPSSNFGLRKKRATEIDYGRISVSITVNILTVFRSLSSITDIAPTQSIAFGNNVNGNGIQTTIIPKPIPNQGISGTITFTKYSVNVS